MDTATMAIYDRCAEEWGARRGPAVDDRAEGFRRSVGSGLIADLGCGVGRHLAPLGAPVVGLDASFGMLEVARNAQAPIIHGDLAQLPLSSGSVAGVFARRSYLHLPKSEILHALRDAYRILEHDGLITILMIGGDYEGHDLQGDDFPGRFYACWQAEEFSAVLSEAGFEGVSAQEQPLDGDWFDLWVTARKP